MTTTTQVEQRTPRLNVRPRVTLAARSRLTRRVAAALAVVSLGSAPSRLPFAPVAFASRALTSVPFASAAQRGTRAGTIRGRVELRHVVAASERRPNVADLGTAAERDASDRLRSVVYLETAPRGAFDQSEPSRAVMDQRNETFVPHVLAITTGSTVDFPNSDRIYHNVFSLSKAKQFDLGRYAAGRSQTVRFDRPGIVRVFCEIHSHMSAFILVFNHPFFTVTDTDGRYRLDNVPPGTYNVIAWNEGLASEPKAVVVPDGGTSELDFALR
jgi:plastocyanin